MTATLRLIFVLMFGFFGFQHGGYADHGHFALVAEGGTAQITLNEARGNAFEVAAIDALGAAKNTTPLTVPGLGTSIPDVFANGAVTEVKDDVNLFVTQQLRIQATAAEGPFNLVVSPRTQTISGPLIDAVNKSGGTIRVFNPVTGTFKPWP